VLVVVTILMWASLVHSGEKRMLQLH